MRQVAKWAFFFFFFSLIFFFFFFLLQGVTQKAQMTSKRFGGPILIQPVKMLLCASTFSKQVCKLAGGLVSWWPFAGVCVCFILVAFEALGLAVRCCMVAKRPDGESNLKKINLWKGWWRFAILYGPTRFIPLGSSPWRGCGRFSFCIAHFPCHSSFMFSTALGF